MALVAIAMFGLSAVATAHGPGPGGTHGGAIISNGVIKLGVDQSANLNVPGSVRSVSGTFTTGVRLIKSGVGELEYTADGCTCEGWGVADAGSGFAAYANDALGYGGYSVTSFSASASSAVATSVTTSGGARQLQVTHDYHPPATPNLFEVDVTITNIGTATVSDLRYRRVMDWDIEPTPFAELVSIYAGWPTPPSAVLRTDNNGFNSGNPLSFSSYGSLNQNFDRLGPRDHGAVFDFKFWALAPGEVKRFRTYYGAGNNRADANAALATVGAEVWSFGEPNLSLADSRYSTAIFAFKGVSSRPLANAGPDQNVAVNAVTLNGSASSDPAGGPLSYVWTEGASTIATGATPTVSLSAGVHVLTLTVTSAVTGLTDSDTVVVTVTRPADTTPPVINCPLDAHGDTDPGRCTSVLNPGTATAVDDVDGPVAVTGVRSDGLPLTAPYPVGDTTITWRAVDAAGNVSECHQMVTVHDQEAPSIVVPGNISRSNDAGQCSAVVSVGSATATDNCLDLIFGTHHQPRGKWPQSYGVIGEHPPPGMLAQHLYALLRTFSRTHR